jgi:hypothetical protein
MTDLSPAAQAVKDAALSQYANCNVRRLAWPLDMPVITAALRAAVEQSTYQDAWDGQFTSAEKILAIAAEIERSTAENP